MSGRNKILFLSSQFPNRAEPNSASFNRQQVESLCQRCDVVVVAPIPWFPFKKFKIKRDDRKRLFEKEKLFGTDVYHPPFFYIPKTFRLIYGFLYFICVYPLCLDIYRRFKFEAIYVTWAYPDGFAAMLLARALRKPFLIKVHGSDININFKYSMRKRLILYVLKRANKIFTVSASLKDKLVANGIPEQNISVLYNGVDTEKFKPMPQWEARKSLGITYKGKIILFIGNLKKTKGIEYLVSAMAKMDGKSGNRMLFIVGCGPDKFFFDTLIRKEGLEGTVVMAGEYIHSKIPLWINSCDVLCLPSLTEGLPNVILEALACGKPVVATDVGGVREIFRGNDIPGKLVIPKSASDLTKAIFEVLSATWDAHEIAKCVKDFSWDNNARSLNGDLKQHIRSHSQNLTADHSLGG